MSFREVELIKKQYFNFLIFEVIKKVDKKMDF